MSIHSKQKLSHNIQIHSWEHASTPNDQLWPRSISATDIEWLHLLESPNWLLLSQICDICKLRPICTCIKFHWLQGQWRILNRPLGNYVSKHSKSTNGELHLKALFGNDNWELSSSLSIVQDVKLTATNDSKHHQGGHSLCRQCLKASVGH